MLNNIYPLPADEITATYELGTQELILFAKGESQPITSDIKFVRVPWLGALKFVLQGRVLAIMGQPKSYCVEQRFKMPPPINPYAVVVFAGDSKGKAIPIRFIGLKTSSSGEISEPSTKEDPPKIPQTLALENEEIHVINGRTFKIQVPSEVPRFGSINMEHCHKYLELQTAGIQDKDIFWQFKALQPTPDTQVTLSFSGGIANYVYLKVYDVSIGLGNEPVVELAEDGCIPNFLDRVGRGISKIKEKYPDAQLHDVDARPPVPSPCENPGELSALTIYCEVNDGKQLASVSTGGYDPFSHIYLHEKVLDDRRNIEWPIKMDIVEADELMKQAGLKGSYTGATLDFSILPGGDKEPNYTFSMVLIPGGPRYVRVGVYDGRVTPIDQPLPPNGA